MYDHEKSDPAIVAVKPTNKAGQPAAKLVEPRAGAEGNVSQQSTGRAQYRGTVSQALARLRQAARQRKKEKFTALSRSRPTTVGAARMRFIMPPPATSIAAVPAISIR